ncbi:L-type lectin-domain containing receptor kinase SIT2-like isoform X1 [Typha latifolia]|uniref:L-type lectin-domain containing receptor kinase SIT2-like isoform X1 n=2 Tax=Typha latifolia TaxID=4733 RepID=UPI003C2B3275
MKIERFTGADNSSEKKSHAFHPSPLRFRNSSNDLAVSASEDGFIFNGFRGANLKLDGVASITSNGLLELSNNTRQTMSHAFHPSPLNFQKFSGGKIFSFSTTFVFAIIGEYADLSTDGITFLISRTTDFSHAVSSQYLGLFNMSNNGNLKNHVFAIELDTIDNSELHDIDNNHVGIDINSVISKNSHTAGYYADDTGLFNNLTLISGQVMQVWVDYDGEDMQVNVTLSPIGIPKPRKPLLSSTVDLSTVLLESMYVGFSSSTGPARTAHYVLGWSFKMNGIAQEFDYSILPSLPRTRPKGRSKALDISLPLALSAFLLVMAAAVFFFVRRRIKFAELLEDWEVEYGPHRFLYKDLFRATNGFKDNELLGVGGFGRVYKGVLPTSKMEVAVKRVSHESRQGMKEFIAEIVSMGRLRHRNLVQLPGYCRRKGELLLVYDFMPNCSLDKYLSDRTKPSLDWDRRFQIIKGVASGLLYLHEGWEQVVIHRDIKASNVLLDSEMNGRLGDFGLARLYDHGNDPQTTHVVGTMGYLAPELARTGKATTLTDVFAFGAFILEVACGRRPIEQRAQDEHLVLVDWVIENWHKGSILNTLDSRLGQVCMVKEAEMVLNLGILCSHPLPSARPSMRQVMQYLDGDVPFPELSPTYMSFSDLSLLQHHGFDDRLMSYPSSVSTVSLLSGGR